MDGQSCLTPLDTTPNDQHNKERAWAWQAAHAPARRGVIWRVPSCLALNGPFDFPSWEMFALPPSVSVARLRKRWTLSPMNSSASVDHTPVGAQVRRRDCNPCNPRRCRAISLVANGCAVVSESIVLCRRTGAEEGPRCMLCRGASTAESWTSLLLEGMDHSRGAPE